MADNKIQAQVSPQLKQYMENELQPMLGTSDAQVLRHIVYSWLADHGYLEKFAIDEKGDIDPEN